MDKGNVENLNFIKNGSNNYIVMIPQEMLNEVALIMSGISLGQEMDYLDIINQRLYDNILTRMIASNFIKQKLSLPEMEFIMISASVMNRSLIISVGRTGEGENIRWLASPMYV